MAKPDWQNQNYKKTSGTARAGSMHSKISGNSLMSMHSKIGKPTVKNYADGGEVKYDMGEFAGVDKAVADNESGGSALANENYGDGTTLAQRQEMTGAAKSATAEQVMEASKPSVPKSFGEAFKAAQDGSNFEWNGKQYKKEYAAAPKAAAPKSSTSPAKSFSEDVAERKKNMSVERSMARNENYGNESRRPVPAAKPRGRGVIDTSDINEKTLLPNRR